jgi:hypothetical protein
MKEASPNLFERRLIHEKRSTILIVDFSFKALNQGSIRLRRIIPHLCIAPNLFGRRTVHDFSFEAISLGSIRQRRIIPSTPRSKEFRKL